MRGNVPFSKKHSPLLDKPGGGSSVLQSGASSPTVYGSIIDPIASDMTSLLHHTHGSHGAACIIFKWIFFFF